MWTKVLVGVAIVGGVALVMRWQATRHFVDEPGFELLRTTDGGVEIRRYAPMIVAETRVPVSYDEAANVGFRRLAGYLFGGNSRSESLAMTAPVTQGSEQLAMTVPVTQRASSGQSVIAFVMPRGRSLSSLPVPRDPAVVLREIPSHTVAVLAYSGVTSEAIVTARTRELMDELAREGLRTQGAVTSARYDPPTTLPWLRRNETWVALEE